MAFRFGPSETAAYVGMAGRTDEQSQMNPARRRSNPTMLIRAVLTARHHFVSRGVMSRAGAGPATGRCVCVRRWDSARPTGDDPASAGHPLGIAPSTSRGHVVGEGSGERGRYAGASRSRSRVKAGGLVPVLQVLLQHPSGAELGRNASHAFLDHLDPPARDAIAIP